MLRRIGRVASLIVVILSLPAGQLALATPSQGIDLQISPLPIELSTPPGTTIGADLRVRNVGPQTERLQVRLLRVTEDDNGNVHLNNPGPGDDWVHWVSFDRPVFNAPTNDWQTIHMSINVPKQAAFGYYFAVEYLRASDLAPQPGQAVAHGAVATFVLLNAEAPGAVRSAQVVSFAADHKFYEFLPATFTVKVRNTGNIHVAPTGNIFINRGAKQVDSISVNSAGGNVLPKGSRFFASSWNDGFPVYVTKLDANGNPVLNKNGQPSISLRWDFSRANRLRFGHYTAHLALVYNDGQRDVPLNAYLSFWVIPWRVVGILIVVLIFVGIGV